MYCKDESCIIVAPLDPSLSPPTASLEKGNIIRLVVEIPTLPLTEEEIQMVTEHLGYALHELD